MYDWIHEETLKFEVQYKECVRVLPYEGEDSAVVVKFYVLAGADGISESLRNAAEDCFKAPNVELKWIDLFNDPPRLPPVYSPSGFPTLALVNAGAATEISKVINSNMELFDRHSNITAVYPSWKVKDGEQTNRPCITVYVLGKGCVPLDEDDIPSEICGYPVDVMDGFWFECIGSVDTKEPVKPLKLGVSIGTVK